ncbi:hypothetical protein AB0L41_43260 [Amycolatopsis mediterranei]|uniref:hypothetical protein n=1 Tax=Amycolatopsis mediterranei TaxID=33910 RepID=UPI00343F4132
MLTHAEVYPVARLVEDILGTEVLGKLRAVWRQALRTADDAGEEMLDLGRQWCEILGTDPDSMDSTSPASPTTSDPSGGSPGFGSPSAPSSLADAIAAVLGGVAANVASEKAPEDPAAVAAAANKREDAAEREAGKVARRVFGTGGPRGGDTRTTGTRPPTPEECSAARVLARPWTPPEPGNGSRFAPPRRSRPGACGCVACARLRPSVPLVPW